MEETARYPVMWRRLAYAGLLVLVIGVLLVHRFTSRSSADVERARARVVLQTIHQLEASYHTERGTYLVIDRERNAELLRLKDPPGLFRYRVSLTGEGYVAVAQADLDGDGSKETWMIDQESPEPVLVRRD